MRDGCEAGRRLRVQGTVDEGTVETDAGSRRSRSRSTATRCPSATAANRAGSSPSASRSSSTAAGRRARSDGDRIEVKHSNEYEAENPDAPRRDAARGVRLTCSPRASTGLRAGRAHARPGVGDVRRPLDVLRHPPRRPPHPAQAPLYAWLALAGARARRGDDAAGADHPRLLARLRPAGRLHTTPPLYNFAAMWSSLEGSILLWLVDPRRLHGGRRLALPAPHRRPLVGWALVVMFVVLAFFALLSFGPADPFAGGRAFPASTGRVPTRCCRTTCSCCSTRRSSISATSASPYPSPSPSPPSSPAGSARAGCSRPAAGRCSRGRS